ncbi:Transcriptional regulator GlxA family, contains an amidase domain and an AraC-type DNA-binding HTH domain [Burkholderia sp. YR290]|jgi:transcriptional regulator GlxA family with amidase domain|uniref:GlxA family transcriptional regulator n=1 Tax=Paraburkholderia hospita TaxID=169430 RepID=UPI0009A6AB7E|nr:GlxA family transcriptional regulator [Paraburkholderia hospita]SKC92182.1 transcriptional regulator, AraC family with amidase-like domain [Paraburkholderia hospita]SOE90716.1 Transcriptional regulator GlxA family, contains an amidase domain and an AraC-type DNA-binding HTH domain [Burkholderia sp. YR290]
MHRIGFIVPQRFQMMSLAALTAFEIANMPPAGPCYDVHVLSAHGGPVRSSGGMTLETEAFGDPAFDTVIVGSITEMKMPSSDAAVIAFVQEAAKASRRIASICSGAFVLAEAGLLNGRRATMHWAHASEFRARFPKVITEEDRIFVNDGPIWSSAGMTAGIDLVLALIDNDLGPDAAKMVARLLVMNQRRLGGQMQHSALLDMTPKSDRIELVLAHIRRNLRNPLTVEELAAVANLSPRQFSRAFVAETGQSPAKAVEQLRLEAARFMIEQGRHTINVVAQETGFADRERMRRAFVRTFGVPADMLRRNARREPVAGA